MVELVKKKTTIEYTVYLATNDFSTSSQSDYLKKNNEHSLNKLLTSNFIGVLQSP